MARDLAGGGVKDGLQPLAEASSDFAMDEVPNLEGREVRRWCGHVELAQCLGGFQSTRQYDAIQRLHIDFIVRYTEQSSSVTCDSAALGSSQRTSCSEVMRPCGVEREIAAAGWLWDHGVPVVHIQNWPKQLRRPDAMCVRVGERPVVLAVRQDSTLARLTYLVAHEVGHIMQGHLQADDNAVLVDDTLPVDEVASSKDADERAADAFAMELLGGEALRSASKRLGAHTQELKLAAAAVTAGRGSGLDAGQIVFGWARLHGDWKLAAKAMWYLTTTQAAPVVVNDVAKRYIDLDAVSSDAQEHLVQLTGMQFHDE